MRNICTNMGPTVFKVICNRSNYTTFVLQYSLVLVLTTYMYIYIMALSLLLFGLEFIF
jgi:hypothetical protein